MSLDWAIAAVKAQLRPQEKRDQQVLRIAAGQVQSVDWTEFHVAVTLHGDPTTTYDDVAYHPLIYVPREGENVWIGKFGVDWWVLGVISRNMLGNPTTGRKPSARIERTSNLTIGHNNPTIVVMQSEGWDTDNMVDLVNFPSEIHLTRAGLWEVKAGMNWAANATGRRILDIVWAGFDIITRDEHAIASSGFWSGNCSATVQVLELGTPSRDHGAVGDGIEMVVYQSSGGNLDISQASIPCFLSATWLGPAP